MTKVERAAGHPPTAPAFAARDGNTRKVLRGGTRNSRRQSTKPRPGRPTAARVKAINRALLIAACEEFKRSGYETTRMETIADAAGVSKATLYDRYPTKEALLRAVIADRVAAWSEDWEPEGGPIPRDLRQRLKHRAYNLMKYYCSSNLQLLERLFTSSPSMNELRRMRHEVGHKRTVQVIAQDIIDGTEHRAVQPRSAIRVAEMLMAMLYGWWRTHQDIRPVRLKDALIYADHAVDTMLDGRSAWNAGHSDV
jgi:TetR/AcrR family transcriptional regulator, mexJK operon transcriptional repressor